MANVISEEKQKLLLHMFMEGIPLRMCERFLDLATETVRAYHAVFGDAAIDFLDCYQTELLVNDIQVDELRTFIACKEFNVDSMANAPDDAGLKWVYASVNPQTSFILNYHSTKSGIENTDWFVDDLLTRLQRNEDGSFVVKPTIISDGLGRYPESFGRYGAWINYGCFEKQYTDTNKNGKKVKVKRYIGAIRSKKIGDMDRDDYNTNPIESKMRLLRHFNARLHRRRSTFSKRRDGHVRSIALMVLYHNYCWVPKRKKVTAAMQLGLVGSIWEIDDVFAIFKHYQARAEAEGLLRFGLEQEPEPPVPFFNALEDGQAATHYVCEQVLQKTAKVHTALCGFCNHGRGRGAGSPHINWHAFASLEDALEAAQRLRPEQASKCRICLGGKAPVLGDRKKARTTIRTSVFQRLPAK